MINYYLITKPGIVMGNLVTLFAGFLLASRGGIDWKLLFVTLLALSCIVACACVLNNILDRDLDRKMSRTKERPLVQGKIKTWQALVFALFLGLLGNALFYFGTNLLTTLLANLGLFIYIVLYTLWKGSTIYGTAIGSIAGALPPVIGYTAVKNEIDLGALLLFFALILWQMPHFFSIAIYRFDDYSRAKIPVLPIEKGMLRTKVHMTLYIIGFIVVSALLPMNHLLIGAVGLAWLALCVAGFNCGDDHLWGRRMFRVSLLVINTLCLGIYLN